MGLAALLVVLTLDARTTRAYEDQLTLGAGLGYAQAVGSDALAHGLLIDVAGSTGLSAEWALRARVSYALHPRAEPLHVAIGAGELLYVVDVLELVPYAGVGAGAVVRARASSLDASPAVHLVAGLDYLLTRSLTFECDLRAHALLTELRSDPLYWALTLSAVLMFDR